MLIPTRVSVPDELPYPSNAERHVQRLHLEKVQHIPGVILHQKSGLPNVDDPADAAVFPG